MVIFTDTNIFIDLKKIGLLKEYFKIAKDVYTSSGIFDNELLSPQGIKEELIELGIKVVSMTTDELLLAYQANRSQPRLSKCDCGAFAIAKCRGWTLATGDRRLRRYSEENGVEVHGLIWNLLIARHGIVI